MQRTAKHIICNYKARQKLLIAYDRSPVEWTKAIICECGSVLNSAAKHPRHALEHMREEAGQATHRLTLKLDHHCSSLASTSSPGAIGVSDMRTSLLSPLSLSDCKSSSSSGSILFVKPNPRPRRGGAFASASLKILSNRSLPKALTFARSVSVGAFQCSEEKSVLIVDCFFVVGFSVFRTMYFFTPVSDVFAVISPFANNLSARSTY